MKKAFFTLLAATLIFVSCHGQRHVADSLKLLLLSDKEDTTQVKHLNKIAWSLRVIDPDSALFFAYKAQLLAVKLGFDKAEGDSYNTIGVIHYRRGEFPEAVDAHLQALKIRENIGDQLGASYSHINLGNVYSDQHNEKMAIDEYRKAAELIATFDDKSALTFVYLNICAAFLEEKNYADGLLYGNKAKDVAIEVNDSAVLAEAWNNIGVVYEAEDKNDEALDAYSNAWKISVATGDNTSMTDNAINIGNIYRKKKDFERTRSWHERADSLARSIGYLEGLRVLYDDMTNDYEAMNDYKTALYYHKKFKELSDSLFNDENTSKIDDLVLKWEKEKSRRELLNGQKFLGADAAMKNMEREQLLLLSSLGVIAVLFISILAHQRKKIRTLQLLVANSRKDKS
ncbi:MAG TPA: tetratricopeptide repeat protein [Bacteroidia bacterium]|nr:tetratricopeptide repeat protein [Bacteroidia bacterium]